VQTLTAEELRRIVSYDPATGVFRWLPKPPTDRHNHRYNSVFGNKPAGRKVNRYVVLRIHGQYHHAGRLAWLYVYGEWPQGIVDYINRDRSDARFCNLRLATRSQDARNRVKPNKTGFKGAHPSHWKPGTFYAVALPKVGKLKHIGCYATAIEAAFAFNVAASLIEPEYSAINDIPEGALTADQMGAIEAKVTSRLQGLV
jgi:hypothetical protein